MSTLREAAIGAMGALETARNGLAWYRDRYPESTDGSDDEAAGDIDAAIDALRAELAKPDARPAPAEPQPAAQQELKPQAATMCSCIECIGDQPEPTPEDLVQAAQQERKPLTDEWINRHSTVAIGCPLGSKVILVSSLRRLLGITATKGER